MDMKALTIWPEWVWAILHLDKHIENRTWDPRTRGLQVGHRLALHAGAYLGGRKGKPATMEALEAVQGMAQRAGWTAQIKRGTLRCSRLTPEGWQHARLDPSTCVRSALAGVATYRGLANVGLWHEKSSSGGAWGVPGSLHWQLADVKSLATPLPCKGAQGLWTPSGWAQAVLAAL